MLGLQPAQVFHFHRSLILGHSHFQGFPRISEIFRGKDATFLSDQEGGAIGVATKDCQQNCRYGPDTPFYLPNVVRTDRQISHLEALDTVDVETFIQHTVFDDAVALLWRHGLDKTH